MKTRKRFQYLCAYFAAALLLFQGMAVYAQDAEQLHDTKRIAVLTYSFSSEYWGYVAQGCEAYEAGDTTVDVTVEGPSSSVASEEQITLLESDLESGRYDGYVIASIDKSQIEELLRDKEVPVMAFDSELHADCVIGCIGTDNEVAAAAGARKAVDMAKSIGWEKAECVMIAGRENDSNNEKRVSGFHSGIEEAEGVWLDQIYYTDKSEEDARKVMDQIMTDHPDGIAIVCCYNDVLAEAALKASKGNRAFDHTVFVGFDGNGSVCERILNDKEYQYFITVAQNPYEMGYHAVEMLSHYFAAGQGDGEEPESGKTTDVPDAKTSGSDKAEDIGFIDSGYSVITNANARERMIQIQSHLS